MTFETGQQQARNLTEKEMAKLWRVVLQTYRDANDAINDDLAKMYAKYLNTVDPEDYYNIMIQYDRLKKLQEKIAKEYATASKKAGQQIAASSQIGMTNTYYREQYTLSYFAKGEMTFSLLNPAIVESSVFGTAEAWKAIQADTIKKQFGDPRQYIPQAGSLTDLLSRNRRAEIEKIQQTISSALIRGETYTAMTKEIKNIIGNELKKNGMVSYTGAKANASRIARTEGTRNLNAGFSASLHNAEAQGLDIKKEWLTAFQDSRDAHKSANRQRVGLDEMFYVGGEYAQFPGNFPSAKNNANCQCSHIAIVDGVEPQLQRARNPLTGENEIFNYSDFDDWANANGLHQTESGLMA